MCRGLDLHPWTGTQHCLRERDEYATDGKNGCVNDHSGCLWNDGHNGCLYEAPMTRDYDSPLMKRDPTLERPRTGARRTA